jgi:ketosteroid isomerase-like protein
MCASPSLPMIYRERSGEDKMIPAYAERELLFKAFARALFAADMTELYRAVTPDFLWSYHDGVAVTKSLASADAIAAHLTEQKALFSEQRFHDVAYHHLPETTFMSFRITERLRATGALREQRGVEHYRFRDGRIATKDVYRKPIEV